MGDNNWYNTFIVMQYIHTVTIRKNSDLMILCIT